MTWSITMADMRQEGFEEGREEGISIGLERGAYQNKLETASRCLPVKEITALLKYKYLQKHRNSLLYH